MFRVLTLDDPRSGKVEEQVLAGVTAIGATLEGLAVKDPGLCPWEQYPEADGRDDLAWLMPLEHCPPDLPADWCITALSERRPAHLALVFPPGTRMTGQLLGLAPGAEVQASGLSERYLRDVRPDLRFSAHAAVRVATWMTRPAEEDAEVLPLHPREFPPPPGAGVWAWVTHPEALPLRRLLKGLHHPDTVRPANLERDLARRFRAAGIPGAGIHAETNPQGHILVWMAWPDPADGSLRRAGASGSTHLGLADLAWAKTGLNFEYVNPGSS